MQTTYTLIKIIHIAAGALALLSGFAAILFRKNLKRHRPIGKFYFWCMTLIFITAIPMALYKFNLFLFFVAVFTYHATTTAYRALKLKKLHEGQKPLQLDWIIEIVNVLTNSSLIIFGMYYMLYYDWQVGVISIVFGLIGLRNSQSNYKRLSGKVSGKNYWLIAHIGGMLGSYIGAITAFTVNNNRWMGLPDVLAWLGPTIILVPFIIYETGKYNKLILSR